MPKRGSISWQRGPQVGQTGYKPVFISRPKQELPDGNKTTFSSYVCALWTVQKTYEDIVFVFKNITSPNFRAEAVRQASPRIDRIILLDITGLTMSLLLFKYSDFLNYRLLAYESTTWLLMTIVTPTIMHD